MTVVYVISSCSVPQNYIGHTNANIGVIKSAPIYQKPLVAEIDVKETKVTGYAEVLGDYVDLEATENEAMVNAIKTAKCDILVNPIFTVEKKENTILNKVTNTILTKVTVEGYPAFYKNIHSIKDDEKYIIDLQQTRTEKIIIKNDAVKETE